MTVGNPDLEKLRVALRRMDRVKLLIVAERAIEIVPKAKLGALIGDMVGLEEIEERKRVVVPLLAEVRKFHKASLDGKYYESFKVNSGNFMEKSKGTDAFIAEFERLIAKCVRAAAKRPRGHAHKAFELLFALLRRLDTDSDDVVFFADEGGSWQVGVDWRVALAGYFQCLAGVVSADEFAREVHRAIRDFSEYDRPRHLAAARRVSNPEQKAALGRQPESEAPSC